MSEPIRSCLGCGQKRPKRALVRLANFEGEVVVDDGRVRPGRGGYLCGAQCLAQANKRKGFGRAFRGKVRVELGALEMALEEQQQTRGVTLTAADRPH